MQRFASKVDANGLLSVAIIEIDDAVMDRTFEENSEMRHIVGVPIYWSQKYGYWPGPTNGWSIVEVAT